jgi:OOP family OmpA-OmpF porin
VISYTIRDTVDLCPGNCGTTLEQQATVPMSRWEATGISGDVPFTVKFAVAIPTIKMKVTPPPPSPPSPPPTHLHTVSAEALFEFSSDKLKPGAEPLIVAAIGSAAANADPKLPVVVRGHTDSIPGPTADYNQHLSERRAAAVAKLLETRFPALTGRVNAIGMADTQPVAPNTINGKDNPPGRAQNRRVDIEIQEVVPGAGP